MSFYSTQWGNIEGQWFDDPEFDQLWTAQCDTLLEQYAQKYAPYLLAYVPRFTAEVLARYKIILKSEKIETAVLTKAVKNASIRTLWEERHATLQGKSRDCLFCCKTFVLLDTHPNVIANCGMDPLWCRDCNYIYRRYAQAWSEDLGDRIERAKATAGEAHSCDFCGQTFNLLNHFSLTRSFHDQGMLATIIEKANPFRLSGGVDYLYPNLFCPVCPDCFAKAFHQRKNATREEALDAFKRMAVMIGKVPTQDFDSYIYYFSTPDSIREFLNLMYLIPSPDQLKESFGSFFGTIVKAGILPDGAKRMKIGTMVLADDGDVCFSLVERDIDNYLFAGGIAHKKEPHYPEGDMRADWEILGGETRVFVEYFGLMKNADYAKKAETKSEIAARHGITLVELFPGTEWKKTIQDAISPPGGPPRPHLETRKKLIAGPFNDLH